MGGAKKGRRACFCIERREKLWRKQRAAMFADSKWRVRKEELYLTLSLSILQEIIAFFILSNEKVLYFLLTFHHACNPCCLNSSWWHLETIMVCMLVSICLIIPSMNFNLTSVLTPLNSYSTESLPKGSSGFTAAKLGIFLALFTWSIFASSLKFPSSWLPV